MTDAKRSWDLLPEEKKSEVVKDIVDFFAAERGEEIGVIAAEEILDMFLESSAEAIYNQGVEDAKDFLKEKMSEVEIDLETLLKK